VTGASRGIGLGIARMLARNGYELTISSRDAERLQAVAGELGGLGSPHVVVAAFDLADESSPTALASVHIESFTTLDVLVLNAGRGAAGPIEKLPLSQVDKTMAVNFRAPYALVQAALPALRGAADRDPEHGARVIALASIAGVHAEPGLAAYSASKSALLSLVQAVNREESAYGVTATAIAPGFVDTDMAAWVRDRIPREQMIPVDDVVHLVEALVSLSACSVVDEVVVARAASPGPVA
jgi:3-oxoacyl-[acyl-carrier protein] reductase